jgi:hypothetical protein
LPYWDVTGFSVIVGNQKQWRAECARTAQADVVIYMSDLLSYEEFSTLTDVIQGKEIISLPTLHSFRYHPDLTDLVLNGQQLRFTAMGFHSATIFLGFKRGRSVDEVVSVLTDPTQTIFAELAMNDPVGESHWARFAELGIDTKSIRAKASRRESYMHMPNHPNAVCLTSIAQQIAYVNGWTKTLDTSAPAFEDPLEHIRSPVYQSVATNFGIQPHHYAVEHGILKHHSMRQWVQLHFDEYQQWADLGELDQVTLQRDLEPHLQDVI